MDFVARAVSRNLGFGVSGSGRGAIVTGVVTDMGRCLFKSDEVGRGEKEKDEEMMASKSKLGWIRWNMARYLPRSAEIKPIRLLCWR